MRGGKCSKNLEESWLDEVSKIRNSPPPLPEAIEAPTFRPGALLLLWLLALSVMHPGEPRVALPSPARISPRRLHPSLLLATGSLIQSCLLLGTGNASGVAVAQGGTNPDQQDSLQGQSRRVPELLPFPLPATGRKRENTSRSVCLCGVFTSCIPRCFREGGGRFWPGGVFLLPSPVIQQNKPKPDVFLGGRWTRAFSVF